MNNNYVKGTSDNLPIVDLEMLLEYISSKKSFQSAEMRGVKTLRSMREDYGDQAIGYVQLQRQSSICTVEAKICPEHKVRSKNYTVRIVIDETDEKVITAECQDCAAALGCCKHAVAFLAWLHRRSEEPSPTSVACYWKKPLLANVGSEIKFQKVSEMFKHMDIQDYEPKCDLLNLVLSHESAKKCSAHIVHFFQPSDLKKVSLHYMSVIYEGDKSDSSKFLDFCANFLNRDNCKQVFEETVSQSKNTLWYELRYARVTASIIYDAAVCRTLNGSLVENIFSNKNNFETKAMKRGKQLEDDVFNIVKRHIKTKYGEKIRKCGLLLKKEYPMLGASPDGMTDTSVIEIKCPYKTKSISRFYNEGKLTKKYKAQIQLQMLFAEKNTGYFCIADPEFETNKKVLIILEQYDDDFIKSIIEHAMTFWSTAIFPKLLRTDV